jgi:hypothetical protein
MKKIVDFATNFDTKLWEQYQEYLINTTDDLKENYVGLDPRDFLSFPVVIINDKIVCFSALQISDERWAKGIGRCSTRMWIHPDYRHGLSKFGGGDKFLNTTYCLPIQFNVAKLNNLDCLFISREHNLTAFKKYGGLITVNCGVDFVMEPAKYNVCGSQDPVPESCKQWVMLHHLTTKGAALWYDSMSQYIL